MANNSIFEMTFFVFLGAAKTDGDSNADGGESSISRWAEEKWFFLINYLRPCFEIFFLAFMGLIGFSTAS
jgi:hypothetical protein